MLRLKETVIVDFDEKTSSTIVTFGLDQYVIEDDNRQIYARLLKQEIQQENEDDELYLFLLENNLLVKAYDLINSNIDERYGRSIVFLESLITTIEKTPLEIFQSVIQNKVVMIAGLGGIGTVVLMNLLNEGFRRFILVDFDRVEKSNLNRQLFYDLQDVGQYKVDVIKHKIEQRYDNVELQIECVKIERLEQLTKMTSKQIPDVIVGAADTPDEINEILSDYGQTNDIDFVSGSVGIETGNLFNDFAIKRKNSKRSMVGSNSATNMLMGSIVALEVWKKLLKEYILWSNSDHNVVIAFGRLKIKRVDD